MKRIFAALVTAAAAVIIAGCSTPAIDANSSHKEHRIGLAKLVYLAAQTLGDRAELLDRSKPVIVTTIVSVDKLNESSTFGRLVSQMVANRIQQRGFLVRDITYMRALETQSSGELVLTREASKLGAAINAQAVVVGTYAVAGEEIYVNLRLLNASNGEIISSADAVIPLDENTDVLTGEDRNRKFMLTLEQFEDHQSVAKQEQPEAAKPKAKRSRPEERKVKLDIPDEQIRTAQRDWIP